MSEGNPAIRLIQHKNSQLLNAVQDGDLNLVLRCLDLGASPQAVCRDSLSSACHVAALQGHAEVLKALLRAGANPGALNQQQNTPLHMATWAGHLDCIDILQSASVQRTTARDDDTEKCNDSDLHDHLSLTKLLPVIENGSTPLHVASMHLHRDCLAHLMRRQPDVSVKDCNDMTALDVAGTASSEENFRHFRHVVAELLRCGRQEPQWQTRALLTAASRDEATVLRALLDAGAAPGIVDERGDTALHVAARWHCEVALRELLGLAVVDVNSVNNGGETALHIAVAASWPVGVDLLLVAGADHLATTAESESVLHLAAAAPSAIVLRALLQLDGVNEIVNLETCVGETALVKAIYSADKECLDLLIRSGSPIKQRDALLKAVISSNLDIVRLLLGATPVTNDEDPNLSHETDGLSLEVPDDLSNQILALQAALRLDNVTITKALIEQNPHLLELEDDEGRKPIHQAILSCSRSCAFLLLSMNADLSSELCYDECIHTTFSLILTYLPQPMKFLTEVFDSFITMNDKDINDYNSCIKLNYGILLPNDKDKNQMSVLQSLLNSDNQFLQFKCSNRALVDSSLILKCFNHPLVESFLILKWKKLRGHFLIFLIVYGNIASSLTTMMILQRSFLGTTFDTSVFCCIIFAMSMFYGQESQRFMVAPRSIVKDLEFWLNAAIILLFLSFLFLQQTSYGYKEVSMLLVLLSWVEFTFLLSRLPTWGKYVHMFSTVAWTVLKIMLSLLFVLVGFTACFALIFDFKAPFNTPWTAILKTIAMMGGDLSFDTVHTSSGVVGCIIFIFFITFVSVIMMNLMLAIAVKDISSLETEGNARRLMKHAQYLAILDPIGVGGFIRKKIPKKIKRKLDSWKNVEMIELIFPGRNRKSIMSVWPNEVYTSIVKIALKKKRSSEDLTLETLHDKLDDLHNVLLSLINKNN